MLKFIQLMLEDSVAHLLTPECLDRVDLLSGLV